MSIATEILRLQKSRDMVAAAEKLKLSGVRKWHRLELTRSTDAGAMATDHGSGVYTLPRMSTCAFTFNANVHGLGGQSDGSYDVCVVVLPVGQEHTGMVHYVDIDDGGSPSDYGYVLSSDLPSDGLVTHDEYITLRMENGAINLSSEDEDHDSKLFIAVYSRCNNEFDTNDENSPVIGGGYEYVDGTETIDELAVSIYKYENPEDTGINTNDATATATDVAQGKTFYAKGSKVSGSLVVRNGWDIEVDKDGLLYFDGSSVGEDVFPDGIYKNCTIGLTEGIRTILTEYNGIEAQLAEI